MFQLLCKNIITLFRIDKMSQWHIIVIRF